MKKLLFSVLTTSLLAAPLALASSDLKITEIHSAGSGNSTYKADWFELTNFGTTDINITGWKVDDNSQSPAAAVALNGITTIGAGKSVVFIEGNSSKAAEFITAWFGATAPVGFQIGYYSGSGIGLSQSTDQVNIYNGSTLVSSVWFGPATDGKTFDNSVLRLDDTLNQLTNLSVLNVNGAFQSVAGMEIGSPGQIPEPSTYAAILGTFALGFAAYRRRLASA